MDGRGTGYSGLGNLSGQAGGFANKIHRHRGGQGAIKEQASVTECAHQKSIDLHWEDEVYFGGFGKLSEQLIVQKAAFESKHGFAIDAVYNAKVWAYIQRTTFEGSVLWINTGGVFTP